MAKDGPYEGKDGPASHTGGVKPVNLEGRFARQRERLAGGFTDADRAWRKQWLNDQVLHHEPVTPDWYFKERYNMVRRMYRFPLDTIFKVHDPKTSWWGHANRFWLGKTLLGVSSIYIGWYIFKYHSNDWQNVSGFEYICQKPFVPMGHPDFGKPTNMKPADYYDNRQGIDKSPI